MSAFGRLPIVAITMADVAWTGRELLRSVSWSRCRGRGLGESENTAGLKKLAVSPSSSELEWQAGRVLFHVSGRDYTVRGTQLHPCDA
jgi:hypothetical protein